MSFTKPLVSIVLPAYNEEANLPELYERLADTVANIRSYDFEFLLIDNCSSDGTPGLARGFVKQDSRWRLLRFSRNFGAEVSLAAGLHYAKGDALIFMATDLQDPPEMVPVMIANWEAGFEVVYGKLRRRSDSGFLKTIGARVAYWLIYRLSDVKIPPDATDFRLVTRSVAEALNRCGEQNRYLRGLVHWVGFRQVSFEYDRAERKAGRSTANLIFCIKYAFNAVMAFSSQPLRLATYVGLAATLLSFIGIGAYTAIYLMVWSGTLHVTPPPAGWTTVVLAILLFSGLQSVFMGLMGEYLANVYQEVKRRPLWVLSETAGFEARNLQTVLIGSSSEVKADRVLEYSTKRSS
jgi:glycosyltransferase involved in cell wall biosynthesis